MTLEPYEDECTPLPDRLTAYYRHVVATHADDPIMGACLICKVSRCDDWRSAAERLVYTSDETATPVDVPASLSEDGAR